MILIDALFGFDPALLATFIFAGFLLNATPGVDFLFVTSSGLTWGGRNGTAAAIGVALGVFVHVAAAAAGISALLLAYPGAYQSIKVAGALYLLFLAWRAWNASQMAQRPETPPSFTKTIRRGFLTNVLNPKTALFIFAFIPQFTSTTNGPLWAQLFVLGVIFLINGFLFSLMLALAAGRMSTALQAQMRLVNKLTAILFSGLAARLIFD